MAVSCMARDSASSALSTFPNVVAGVTSPCMDAGQVFRDRYDVEERQRHETADGERCRQVVIHGGGQVLDDFEEVEDGLDEVCGISHVPWYAFAGHVYLAADSGRSSICVRCPVPTTPTRNWPCLWSATSSPMSPRGGMFPSLPNRRYPDCMSLAWCPRCTRFRVQSLRVSCRETACHWEYVEICLIGYPDICRVGHRRMA